MRSYSRIIEISLAVIATAVMTFLFTIIVNPQLQFLYLLMVLEGCIAGFLIIFGIGLYKDRKKIMMAERVPNDAILKKQNKEVIFDEQTFKDKTAKVKVFRRLYNNMKEQRKIYRFYRIEVYSLVDVPRIKNIKLLVDGEKASKMHPMRSDAQKIKTVSFSVPLNLEAGKTKDFIIEYRTKAYQKAIEGRTDFFHMSVRRVVNELEFGVLLQKRMKDRYEVVRCENGLASYEIYDASNERMETTERYLMEEGAIPEFQGGRARWSIINPKIGYSYRLYFKLVKKRK